MTEFSSGITVRILSPHGELCSHKACQGVVLPGWDGLLGVKPGHAALFAIVRPGLVTIQEEKEEKLYVVTQGFTQVDADQVVLIVEAGEKVEKVDKERAREAMKRAKERLTHFQKGLNRERAEMALARASARLCADVSRS